MRVRHSWLAAFVLMWSAAAFAEPVQIIVDGVLVGATGVEVGGSLYDVSFMDGDCPNLFTGCNEPTDFVFSADAAFLAAQALLDTVLIGEFDFVESGVTQGCGITSFGCNVFTPYEMLPPDPLPQPYVLSAAAANGIYESTGEFESLNDAVYAASFQLSYDLGTDINQTWAVWRPSTSAPIPEPGTLVLMGTGALGVFRSTRRSRWTP